MGDLSERPTGRIADHRSEPGLSPAELIPLLELQVRRYTMDESSSVPMEVAQRLLNSIRFALRFYKSSGLPDDTPALMLEAGTHLIREQLQRVRALYDLAEKSRLPVNNQSYEDTFQALKYFFTNYDYRFFAHEIPCMIDYQLHIPVSGRLEGIHFIQEYLMRLIAENRFCRCFDARLIVRMLKQYYRDYEGLLINMMEPVLMNALGLCILKQDVRRLLMTEEERQSLFERMHPWNRERTDPLVLAGAASLCGRLAITDDDTVNYLKTCVAWNLPWLRSAGQDAWEHIFTAEK